MKMKTQHTKNYSDAVEAVLGEETYCCKYLY